MSTKRVRPFKQCSGRSTRLSIARSRLKDTIDDARTTNTSINSLLAALRPHAVQLVDRYYQRKGSAMPVEPVTDLASTRRQRNSLKIDIEPIADAPADLGLFLTWQSVVAELSMVLAIIAGLRLNRRQRPHAQSFTSAIAAQGS